VSIHFKNKSNVQAAIDRGELEAPAPQLVPPESFPVTSYGNPIIPTPDIIPSEQVEMDQLRRQISGVNLDFTPSTQSQAGHLQRQFSA